MMRAFLLTEATMTRIFGHSLATTQLRQDRHGTRSAADLRVAPTAHSRFKSRMIPRARGASWPSRGS